MYIHPGVSPDTETSLCRSYYIDEGSLVTIPYIGLICDYNG